MRLIETISLLERVYDRVVGEPGAGARVLADGKLPKYEALIVALAKHVGIDGAATGRGKASTSAPRSHKAPASAESVLDTYQRLLTEKPREAGTFYQENAEQILAGLAAREREQRAALE